MQINDLGNILGFFLVILYLLQRYKEFLEYTNIYKSIFDFYKFNTHVGRKTHIKTLSVPANETNGISCGGKEERNMQINQCVFLLKKRKK
jgi:hypothetical protein